MLIRLEVVFVGWNSVTGKDDIFDYYRTNDVYRYGNDFEELYNYGPD